MSNPYQPAYVRLSVPNLTPAQALNAWNYVLHLSAAEQPITTDVLKMTATKAAANVQLPGTDQQVAASAAHRPGDLYDYFAIPRPGTV